MACLNPHSYVLARDDPAFRSALKAAEWLVPDGAGIILGGRFLGVTFPERVSGPDVFAAVMQRLQRDSGSVFFLGSSEEVLRRIRERFAEAYPDVVISGTYSPPFEPEFSEETNIAMVEAVNRARPDVLWVGISAPRQEKWLADHAEKLDVGVAGAVGAAFDFFAGTVNRSPAVFRRTGLEWLPRLLQQPRRLWRRMGVSAPIFLGDVLRARVRGAADQ